MARQKLLLDLFCKAGGATRGYQQAGFTVIGVDISPQPNYVGEDFLQADALSVLKGQTRLRVRDFTVIHASPPCQRYCKLTACTGLRSLHPDLIGPTRQLLLSIPRPYILENIPSAPLRHPLRLRGSMFNLQVRRHRLFESNILLPYLPCQHHLQTKTYGVYGSTGGYSRRDDIHFGSLADWSAAMGIDWMTTAELTDSIPPAYTHYIGTAIQSFLSR